MSEVIKIRKATVAIFMFNRPDLLERTLKALWTQSPARLLVFCDGPRSGVDADRIGVERCREIIDQIPWECPVEKDYSDANLGLEKRFISALKTLEELGEPFIVIEDDCVPGDGFIDFCEAMLEKYETDSRIGMIQGGNLLPNLFRGLSDSSYRFSRRPKIWGWASWPRALNGFDVAMPGWSDCDKKSFLKSRGLGFWEIRGWIRKFDAAGSAGTWDYQWVYHLMRSGLLSVAPRVNLIENIGFGDSATHTKIAWPSAAKKSETLRFPLRHPEQVIESRFQDQIEPISVAFSNFVFATRSPQVWKAVVQLAKTKLAEGSSRGS